MTARQTNNSLAAALSSLSAPSAPVSSTNTSGTSSIVSSQSSESVVVSSPLVSVPASANPLPTASTAVLSPDLVSLINQAVQSAVQASQRQPGPAIADPVSCPGASSSSASLGGLASTFFAAGTGFPPSLSSSSTSGVPEVSTPGSVASSVHSTSSPGRIDWLSLERQCQFLLAHGLADSTRRSYASGQRKFVNFCAHLGKLHPSGSPCPTDEWTLCLFATFLAGSVQHSSIKVYLSAVRALHIEEGFPDPLVNCLRLQRVLRGIKRTQGSPEAQRLPITDHILMIIFRSLDLSIFDHCMFWAACNLAYFGFLRSAEFTVPNLASFTPALHLSVGDISVDSDANPSCLRVRIKASKTDPFRKGCFVHIGRGRFPLCALQAVLAYLAVRGNSGGPLFLFQDGRPLTRAVLTARLREILAGAGVLGNFSSHSFRIGAATVAARNGIPDHLIQALGRWCSSAYQSYIRTPSESLASLSSHLASGSVGS
ncbi:uncharacterized protein [Montipora capricornis]|uniref:uncharacterized protein n=1 Tax=Montipora capricornis TaxID=246305 RepID=UPI0035F1B654